MQDTTFQTLIFQTKELGTLVTFRRSVQGVIGDITATQQGIVVTGHFDLSTEQARTDFNDALSKANAVFARLVEGPPHGEEPKDDDPHGVRQLFAFFENRSAHQEDPTKEERGLLKPISPLLQMIRDETPLTVGSRALRVTREIATTVTRSDERGKAASFCGICRKPIDSEARGHSFEKAQLETWALYPHPTDERYGVMVLETREPRVALSPFWERDQATHMWVHDCVTLRVEFARLTFGVPALLDR